MSRAERWTIWLFVLAAFIWSAWATELSARRMVEGVPFMIDFMRRMVPPDVSVLGNAVRGAVQTLEVSVVGTLTAAVIALPLGFA
ncbi:MAG: phosphonate ABC transporter, permease protein PhnE, partial [Candidatus Rokuibacteriota bacterium]